MVESPRIKITFEKIKFTKGNIICKISGSSYKKMNVNLENYVIRKWWFAGKYIYVHIIKENNPEYVIRTHMMMYGKILLNNENVNPNLKPFMVMELSHENICNQESKTILKWYLSQIKLLDPNCDKVVIKTNYSECSSRKAILDSIELMKYDLSNNNFNENLYALHLKKGINIYGNEILTDFLLNQEYFPGVGNILQQEALYRCKLLPTNLVSNTSKQEFNCLVSSLKNIIELLHESYLRKNEGLPHIPIFQIYHKSICPLGHKTITKYIGHRNRKTTWCPVCQK
ncbi:formamidopyrimidine-DNA glycosylase [Acanthamoeba polyphaga moumouvirus]|uniref:Formamidopyrimidine-DNA glycosylase n=2 Tax=Moumouvirus TaxID=3080801 RepID=L7RBZ0_9VIRU|nr:formamidopyrimidine-DNA glycosylase [Acanthamoeba polyphaga moumouvirus]AEX63079.1 endonuclease VIII-like protein [Moumouvirus Monve]AGC01747.1 formamidopyrimidine-DNA glycosylase [Acanthamoeba polyphaga moumouvirus]AQN68093.1 formamidopyrimidine-DNA glycosylase [Saudi moumouvirus]